MLGWFTYRADTNLTPSMREQVHPVNAKPKTVPCAFQRGCPVVVRLVIFKRKDAMFSRHWTASTVWGRL